MNSHEEVKQLNIARQELFVDDQGYNWKYKESREIKGGSAVHVYRCVMVNKKQCKMTVNIGQDGILHYNSKAAHSCLLSDHTIKKSITKMAPNNEDEILEFIQDKLSEPAPSVYEKYLKFKNEEKSQNEAGYFVVKSSQFYKIFYCKRCEVFPDKRHLEEQEKILTSISTKDNLGYILEVGKTNLNGKNLDIALFSSPYQQSVLARSKKWFIDCTFKCTPKYFIQTMIIIARDDTSKTNIPCFWGHLPNKEEVTYEYCLRKLLLHLKLNQLEIDLDQVSTDFEKGLFNSCIKVLRPRKLYGCFFHLVKALWTKAGKLGLRSKDNFEITKKIIDSIKLITHLKREGKIIQFANLIESVQETCRTKKSAMKTNSIKFLKYFFKNYLDVRGAFYEFADYSTLRGLDENLITNNICEGYNHRFQKRVGLVHASLTFVTRILIEEESFFKKMSLDNLSMRNSQMREFNKFEDSEINIKISKHMIMIENFLSSQNTSENAEDFLKKFNLLQFELEDEALSSEDEENQIAKMLFSFPQINNHAQNPARGQNQEEAKDQEEEEKLYSEREEESILTRVRSKRKSFIVAECESYIRKVLKLRK